MANSKGILQIVIGGKVYWATIEVIEEHLTLPPDDFSKRFLAPAFAALQQNWMEDVTAKVVA